MEMTLFETYNEFIKEYPNEMKNEKCQKTCFCHVTKDYMRKSLNHRLLISDRPLIKLRLSPLKKNCFICFNESSLKMMKNRFYIILKSFFVPKIFKYLP